MRFIRTLIFACQTGLLVKCLLNINCVLILVAVPISVQLNVLPHCIRTDCHGLYFYWNKECIMKSDYIQSLIFLSWLSVVWLVWKPVLCTKRAWISKLAVAKMAMHLCTPVICWATVNTTTCHVMFKSDQSCIIWLHFFIIVSAVGER